MTRTLLIAVFLLGSAVFQTAQPAQVSPPDVDLGDTRGADFDVQAVGTATPADFDFLVGTWTFQFQQQAEPGKYRPTQTGVWTVQKTHDDHIVEDVWRLGTTTNPTITYRVFNPARKLWEIQGTKPGMMASRGPRGTCGTWSSTSIPRHCSSASSTSTLPGRASAGGRTARAIKARRGRRTSGRCAPRAPALALRMREILPGSHAL